MLSITHRIMLYIQFTLPGSEFCSSVPTNVNAMFFILNNIWRSTIPLCIMYYDIWLINQEIYQMDINAYTQELYANFTEINVRVFVCVSCVPFGIAFVNSNHCLSLFIYHCISLQIYRKGVERTREAYSTINDEKHFVRMVFNSLYFIFITSKWVIVFFLEPFQCRVWTCSPQGSYWISRWVTHMGFYSSLIFCLSITVSLPSKFVEIYKWNIYTKNTER